MIPFRREVALGDIRGGAVPWGVLLPLMVRSNDLSSLKLNPRLVGTNVRNLASGLRFSPRRPRYQARLEVCSPCVEFMHFRESYSLVPPKGRNLEYGWGRGETCLGVDIHFGGTRNCCSRFSVLLDRPGLPRQRQVPHQRRADRCHPPVTDG